MVGKNFMLQNYFSGLGLYGIFFYIYLNYKP